MSDPHDGSKERPPGGKGDGGASERSHGSGQRSGPEPTGRLEFSVPLLAPGTNGLMRMNRHVYQRRKKKWGHIVAGRVRAPVRVPCVLWFRRRTMSLMDLDNLYGSLKMPLDAMQMAGVIPEDNPDAVTAIQHDQVRVGKKGEQGMDFVLAHVTNAFAKSLIDA